MRKNIFVIGDLVIDHAIFVEEQHRTRENEDRVIRRQDTAGGAANTARILSVLNRGQTYLWGVIGTSHWGNFRSILEASHLLDGSPTNVELRGIHDETDAKMNTITRLITDEGGKKRRKLRYDDVDHVHVSDTKRETALHHLKRISEDKGGLDAIIINDFDKKCLTKENVEDIYKFAAEHNIPLFVDPKRDGKKYLDIEGVAILPNLEEWCWLVDEKGAGIDNYRMWQNGLDNAATLEKMAQKSLQHLSNFKYHIIKCAKLGAVIIGPHPSFPHYCAVYRIHPAPINEQESVVFEPLGCGDTMTGAFAFYYDKERESTEMALEAFHRANIVVGCYREMPWHRMPPFERVEKRLRESEDQSGSFEIQAVVSKAIAYLPKELKISLAAQQSECVPGIYLDKVRDTEYLKSLNKLAQDAAKNYGWPAPKETVKNIIFGAPSGTGKTTILDGLESALKETPGICALRVDRNNLYKDEVLASLDIGDAKELRARLATLANENISEECTVLLVIDEAYDKRLEGQSGKPFQSFLQAANAAGIRLLLADSEFAKFESIANIRRDISTRCNAHNLPALTEHPMDIPYILFGELLKYAEDLGDHHPISVENHVVLELIELVLKAPNGTPREALPKLKEAYKRAAVTRGQVTIKYAHWASVIGKSKVVTSALPDEFYTISR